MLVSSTFICCLSLSSLSYLLSTAFLPHDFLLISLCLAWPRKLTSNSLSSSFFECISSDRFCGDTLDKVQQVIMETEEWWGEANCRWKSPCFSSRLCVLLCPLISLWLLFTPSLSLCLSIHRSVFTHWKTLMDAHKLSKNVKIIVYKPKKLKCLVKLFLWGFLHFVTCQA